MNEKIRTFLSGARKITPVLPSLIPFGMIFGVAAVELDLPPLLAVSMSIFVFAGASQLAAIDLLGQHSSLTIIAVTALVINLRFTMYSASLAPHFLNLPAKMKVPLAYLLTDQAYAVTITNCDDSEEGREEIPHRHKVWFYLGAALPVWSLWQLSTGAGLILGAGVPESWSLDFAVPLTFLALLVPAVKDRATAGAAIAAGIAASLTLMLPYNLSLMIGALSGVGLGVFIEGRKQRNA